MLLDISDKVIVITGASRGLGRDMAKLFASEGAVIVINYNSSVLDAEYLYKEILSNNGKALLISADITKMDEVEEMCKDVISKFGKVDVLVNNAGILNDNPIQLMSKEQWSDVIDVNLTGTFYCSKVFSKVMLQQKSGQIINIASLKGEKGSPNQINYASSKAGVIALTKSLAKEFKNMNISVNAICPGFIVTDLNKEQSYKKDIAKDESLMSIEHLKNTLLSFLVYLISSESYGISGRVFNLDSRV
ncbi:SDR family NAD(P)-dependent oxidoreductase [Lactococcus lactis subsp. lactis]|uniref:SDR family NAD(P)-dependent oxidoreductase n=1 Tax=Lactococcus lactis TaxID=1358 RepID=UPI00223B6F64|nr:SDR family NAD(P)-dependent oxidoreductase [Lactococcus lactis]MCT0016558.1 SDR family NAD(P)-dependent oxidoreductase [Lactococcus lactis subsp. lactis]